MTEDVKVPLLVIRGLVSAGLDDEAGAVPCDARLHQRQGLSHKVRRLAHPGDALLFFFILHPSSSSAHRRCPRRRRRLFLLPLIH